MKLRNKKTGEIFDALIREKGGGGSYSLIVCDIKAYEQSKSTLDATHFVLDEYDSLAELNEEWEDYKPAEPLIKDEKIRKAIRAWAEGNEVYGASTYKSCSGGHHWYIRAFNDTDRGIDIDFWGELPRELIDCQYYTIAELCGEEEK